MPASGKWPLEKRPERTASTEKTHSIMLIMALRGLPGVLAHNVSVCCIFRGQVKLASLRD